MTGKEATFGAQFLAGASAAVADINAKGGVLGKPLKLITGDDQCNPKQAHAVAEQLSASGAVLVGCAVYSLLDTAWSAETDKE